MVALTILQQTNSFMQSMEYDKLDDHELVDGILNNDQHIIDYFFNKKCSKLFEYIIINVFDCNLTEKQELANELFLLLAKDNWYKVRQFDFRSKLMTWVSVVAVRFFQKKRKELIERSSPLTPNEKTWHEHSAGLSADNRIDIRAALQRMPNARYRKVIEELDLQDMQPDKLAKEMKVTVDNLYNIHRRALAQLRLIMGRKEEYYG